MTRLILLGMLWPLAAWGDVSVSGLKVVPGGKPGFQRLAGETTGILFTNLLADSRSGTNRILLGGSGVAAGDVDGDGWCDLYFCGMDNDNVLYRNRGDWTFEDVTREAGVGMAGMDCSGAVFADVEGDGDLDLLVTAVRAGVRLLLNDGKGNFREHTEKAGIASANGSTSMALADVDGDGDLDLYVANLRSDTVNDAPTTSYSIQTLNRRQVVTAVNGRSVVAPDLTNRFAIGEDGMVLEYGEADRLYLNEGDGTFRHASFTGGTFLDEAGAALKSPPYDWGLAVQFYDFTGDGAPDIYVCNDYFTPDRIWINDGKGGFRAASPLAVRRTSYSSMGVDCGDVNRDGWPDLYVVDMFSRSHRMRQIQIVDVMRTTAAPGQFGTTLQIPQNTLQLNRGDGTFEDVAIYSGVEGSEWSWCPVFLDVDLDGWEDLLISNGHRRDLQNADASARIKEALASGRLSLSNPGRIMEMFPTLAVKTAALKNMGDLTFREVGTEWGFADADISHGLALADLDNDGDLDVVMNNLGTIAGVYRNQASERRVAVRLAGKGANRHGVGAKITLSGGGLRQTQEMISGGRYLSGDQMQRTFAALGDEMTLEVRWRSGKQTVVQDVKANHLYAIEE